MAKQIFDFVFNPTPQRNNILLVEPSNGASTYKMTIAALAALITKTDVGLPNVENTALSTWAGSANILSVGVVTAGTWQGAPIVDAFIDSAAVWNAKRDPIKGINNQGDDYTLTIADLNRCVPIDSGSGEVVTLPEDLPIGFECDVVRLGTGTVTFNTAGGASFVAKTSHDEVGPRYGRVKVLVIANSGGNAAVYLISGDTTT